MVFSPNKASDGSGTARGRSSTQGTTGLLKVHIPASVGSAGPAGGHASSTSGCSPSTCSIGSSGAYACGGVGPMSPAQQLPSPRIKEEWFSLEGPLHMKSLGGVLSMMQPRKRYYFGLEEVENKLVFYRNKADFDARKDCLGQISMNGTFCSLDEANFKAFYLHTEAGKKYFVEADNERAADCWLNALQQRREEGAAHNGKSHENGNDAGPLLMLDRRHRSRSKSLGHSDSDSELLAMKGGLQRERARSHYHPQKRHLAPLRLIVPTAGLSTTLESVASSTPSTPMSMPAVSNDNCWGLSRSRKYSRALPRKSSSIAQLNKAGNESPPKRRMMNGAELDDYCCVCGASNAASQWMLDSWLRDQQRHGHQNAVDKETTPTESCVDRGTTTGTASDGSTAEADLLDSPSSVALPAANPECQSIVSSETCESAGVLAANEQRSRDDELAMLRKLSNRQKELILELRTEMERTRKTSHFGGHLNGDAGECHSIPEDSEAAFLAKSRFLNAELLRVHERKQEADKQIEAYKRRIAQLEAEMEDFKKEYIHLLQSCVRIPLRENSACDIVQVKLFGGDEHERRVKKLLERARECDPTLPTFESVTGRGCFHVDEYGFRHNFEGEVPLAVHFIATQLHQHYQAQSADHVQLKARWRALLETQPERIERNRETRQLCRQGIPRSLRSKVWRLLINQQVADLKAKYGPYYYRDLCSSQGTPAEKHYSSAHQKQVNLDLLRTMPNNVHFMSASCKGVTHLQTVLRAYCLHNPGIGYCQGMNFLVATALLFMSPEDAFWFLVAITQRYFDASYFDSSLTGAQADQEVLKEIVEQKFPRLAQHLDECEIDLTTVTLNWFIALFFDAVPFQTMLRFWDCFLMEGPKVLFRFTIALLGLYEEDILAHSDTISVIKVLKAGVRLTLDVDGLIKYAFEELNPFPSKAYLRQRQSLYLQVLQERLHKRQQLRQFLNVSGSFAQSDQLCDLPIEVVVFSPFVQGRAYVCAGNQKRGKLAMIQLHEEAVNLNTLDLEFDCRPVSMVIFQPEMAFVSLLSGYIMAVHLRPSGPAEILWELKLNDVALKLVHCSSRLYSCLANGTLAVLENAFERMPSALDLYHIPVAAAPITDALVDEEHLYLAVACKVVVLNRQTLSTVSSVYVASAAAGSQVPMFEKIRALAKSPHGIWLATAHSSLLQLWRDGQCEMLFDIRYDHSHRKPSFDEHDDLLDQVEVCSILFHADELWVGTVDGYLMLYRVHLAAEFGSPKCLSAGKYLPGKRLSPAHGLAQAVPPNRQQTYYIPTESEKQVEERNSSMECMMEGPERQASRKISVKIDQNTRKYSVNVLTLRHPSIDSGSTANSLHSNGPASGPMRLASCSTQSEPQQPTSKAAFTFPAGTNNENAKRKLCTQQSIDSAFSSMFDSANGNGILLNTGQAKPSRESPADRLSTSLENEDFLGEAYSRSEEELEEVEVGRDRLQAEEQRRRFPCRLVRINSWRKMSSVAAGPPPVSKPIGIAPRSNSCSYSETRKHSFTSTTTTSGTTSMADRQNGVIGKQQEEIRIRRKDLDFEEPLLLAVKEGESLPPSLGASPPTRHTSFSKMIAENTPTGPSDLLETTEIKNSLGMALQMKLKVADKSVRCIAAGHFQEQDVILTGAGEYGDEEALLRWRRDPNSGLWINDPLVDIGARGRIRTGLSSPTRKRL